MKRTALLLIAALVLTTAAWLRGPEYDEAYSIFLTAGDARPAWPTGAFLPATIRPFYTGHASFTRIAHDLRTGDVHPPLYFWILELWRRLAGPSWFAARLLSVLCTIAGLAALGWLAALAEIPASTAILIALSSYGFTYAGIVARGFALAQCLDILGVALVFAATRRERAVFSLAGGLAFGAASFTNYLAVFTGIAALIWLAFEKPRHALLAVAGLALFAPADAWFFLAQRSSRIGQFQAFSPPHAVALLIKDSGAALFGGLPLYAGPGAPVVALILLALLLTCIGTVMARWTAEKTLFAATAVSTPLGLLALGFMFNNTPIEIRYLAFGIPYLALLFAAALPRVRAGILVIAGAGAIIGLAIAPATMQAQGATARAAAAATTQGALVLLPFGNDGVGVPGPFIAAAPDDLRIELVRPGVPPGLSGAHRVILALVNADDASRQTNAQLLTYFSTAPCWTRSADPAPTIRVFSQVCTPH